MGFMDKVVAPLAGHAAKHTSPGVGHKAVDAVGADKVGACGGRAAGQSSNAKLHAMGPAAVVANPDGSYIPCTSHCQDGTCSTACTVRYMNSDLSSMLLLQCMHFQACAHQQQLALARVAKACLKQCSFTLRLPRQCLTTWDLRHQSRWVLKHL